MTLRDVYGVVHQAYRSPLEVHAGVRLRCTGQPFTAARFAERPGPVTCFWCLIVDQAFPWRP